MTSFRKNLMVGMTMLVALALLGLMILLFGEVPIRLFSGKTVPIHFDADSAEGISGGSPISYLGVTIGKVSSVELNPTRPGHVRIAGRVEARYFPLPNNLRAVVKPALIGGSSSINLVVSDKPRTGELPAGATLLASREDSIALPRELKELAANLAVVAREITERKIVEKVASTLASLQSTIDHAGKVLDDVHQTVGDEKVRKDIQETLRNFKTISASGVDLSQKLDALAADLRKVAAEASGMVVKTGGHVDDLAKRVGDRLDQVAGILEKFQTVAQRLDKGEGTAGKLINDPRLYDSLVETTGELALTIKDLRRLIEQWEQEGVSVKMGGKK